jgi:integrase
VAWVRIEKGRSLGYRRPTTEAGRWSVRVFLCDTNSYRKKSLGTADDLVEADGERILSYGQALEAARAWEPNSDEVPKATGVVTVADVMEDYLEWYSENKKGHQQTRYAAEAHIKPELGEIPVEELTTARIRRWHQDLAKKPARLRTSKNAKKKRTRRAVTDDEKRSRRSTANRVLTILKAGLNEKWREGDERVSENREAWQPVRPLEGAESGRIRYLDANEIKRLVNACDPDFRDLVLAAFYTGARYGELCRMRAADLQLESGSVRIPQSKGGKTRTIFLNDEGMRLFGELAAGRTGDDLLFLRSDGEPWGNHQQIRRIRAACEAAKIKPRIVFHELRHTYASLYLMAGGGLPDLAKQLGHSTTRMVEKHYGHLADQWRADQAQKFAPSLGLKAGSVAQLRKKKA